MLSKEVVFNYKHSTVVYGMVQNDTEEYYATWSECSARAKELRSNSDVAYVTEGYWCPTGSYRVLYAYKA